MMIDGIGIGKGGRGEASDKDHFEKEKLGDFATGLAF